MAKRSVLTISASLSCALVLLGQLASVGKAQDVFEPQVLFNEEFDGKTLNKDIWSHDIGDGCDKGICGWGNYEVATFTNDEKNIRVEDGMLKITALHDNVDNEDAPFSSAKILTKSKYTARFGRIEARIKVPDAGCQGLWPAFWMLPQSNVYGGWPDSGEIDIMENANDMTDPAGTLHFEMGGQHVWVGNSYIAQPNFELAFDPSIFHIYALEWTPNGLQWFIDDVLLHDIRDWKPPSRTIGSQFPAPFDEEFYIILNLAVGGPDTGYTGQLNADAECIEANAPTMEVDYVRVTSNIPGCGNLLCDNEETCTSCSQDCGSCDDVQGKSALPPQEQSHCLDPFNYPEVEWTHRSSEVAPTPKEGKLGERMEAVMSLGHVRVFDPESGEMTLSSRGFNGMIPGPLLRMRPCHKYRMTIQNGLQGYPNPLKGIANTFKDPMTTSFHSWGPHLSSEQPSESPLFSVQPGEHQEIVYDVPCDHAGGTFFYHPQHQGSSALQTTGGAAGMLIFEDSDLLEGMNRPPEYTEMAEGIVMLMLIDPARERSMGLEAYDTIFDTPHTDPFFLANGCTSLEIPLEHAQWTRLRMAFVGHEEGFFADISPLLGVGACDVKLLAKDGVYLGEMPRSLSSRRLFFAPSSRVDIAIRCSQLGSHSLDLTPVSGASAGKAHTQVATFVVRESHKVADPVDLPPWVPCRPTYLMNRLEETPVQAALPLAVTDGAVNGQAWEGVDGPALHELAANNLYEWEIAGTGQPVHFHVNPLQLVAVSQEWDGMPPEWNMRGDWLDTILAPSAVTARMFTDRWGGTMYVRGSLMQSDLGAMAAISILDGFLPVEERHLANLDDDPPDITYPFPTTCERTPFRGPGQPAQIPGLIEAEMFDFGGPGLGYWDAADFNEHVVSNFRSAEGVDIQPDKKDWDGLGDNYLVGGIRPGEWLQYSTHVVESGVYTLDVNVASYVDEPTDMYIWMDTSTCGVLAEGQLLAHVVAVNVESWAYYETYSFPGVHLTRGDHVMRVCFGTGMGMSLDSILFVSAERTPGSVLGKFADANQWRMNSGWKPTSVLYRPPSQVPLRAERTLLEAAVGADGSYSASSRAKSLRGSIPRQLVSLTTLRDNYLDLIRKEIAGLPRISSAVRIVMDPSDIDVTKAMLKYSRDSGLAVHLTVPVGHSDRENIFNVELAASILADTSPGPIELLVLGEEALSEQTLYHVEKLVKHAMNTLHSSDIPITIGERDFVYAGVGLWKYVDVNHLSSDPFNRNQMDKQTRATISKLSGDKLLAMAVKISLDNYRAVVANAHQPTLWYEVGWPTSSDEERPADASESMQAMFIEMLMQRVHEYEILTKSQVPWGIREAYDREDSSYGVLNQDGTPKESYGALLGTWDTSAALYGTAACVLLLLLTLFAGSFALCLRSSSQDDEECDDTPVLELGGRGYLKPIKESKQQHHRTPVRRARATFTVYTSAVAIVLVLAISAYVCYGVYIKTGGSAGWLATIIILQIVLGVPFTIYTALAGVQNLVYMIFPRVDRAIYQNSEYYSAIPEAREKDSPLLSVTVIMPVYKESLNGIIAPSMRSIMAAVEHFEAMGGVCNILVADDGLQVINEQDRKKREEFYRSNSHVLGYAARPPHNIRHRAGAFKKASNINYLHAIVEQVDQLLQSKPSLSVEQAAKSVAGSQEHTCLAGGRLLLGDLVLLVDCDTRVPLDCLSLVQGEFANDDNLGFVQCRTTPLLMANTTNVVVDMVAYNTADIWDHAIALGCATGIVCPLIGHNAFLRTAALKAAGELLPSERGLIWSEAHVSEDFEMMLRMNACNYFGRYITYTGPDFKEGISLTARDDMLRQGRFAYGAIEVVLNNPREWLKKGILSPVMKQFMRADIPWTSKASTFAYLMNFFAKAYAFWAFLVLLIIFLSPFRSLLISFADPLQVQLSTTLIFGATGLIASVIYRLRNAEHWVGVVGALSKTVEYIKLGTILGTLYHTATLWDATEVQLQYLLKPPGQVTFGATSKTQAGGSLWRSMVDVIHACWVQQLALLLVSSLAFGALSVMKYGDAGDWLADGDTNADPFFWFIVWWVYVGTHVLSPLIFTVLEHTTCRPVEEGKRDGYYMGIAMAAVTEPELEPLSSPGSKDAYPATSDAACTPNLSPQTSPLQQQHF